MTASVPTTVTVAASAPGGVAAGSGSAAANTADVGATAPDPNGVFSGLASGALPGGAYFVPKGKGSWHVVPGSTPTVGTGAAKYTYQVTVEDGIQNAAADQEFAAKVDATLADPRSWIGQRRFSFQRIASGTPSFTISLTSQTTERRDDMCGWQIKLEASCYARDRHQVSINNARWTRGAVSYNGDLGLYRTYAINHEVGHALGYVHRPCSADDGLAPVMMQQSWSTSNDDLSPMNPQLIPMDGKVCRPNPYPFPRTTVSASAPVTVGTPGGAATATGKPSSAARRPSATGAKRSAATSSAAST